jgi:Mlc titration factor MtfA (ptsG expression regulator)/Tfp pilus assembly protein PilF
MFAFLVPARRRHRPFPPAWDGILNANVAVDRSLPADDRARLRAAVMAFLARTDWEGCGGFRLTDEVRATVAAQACLLGLGFDRPVLDAVRTVLVYPGGFLAGDPYEFSDRVVQLTGQAVPGGPVILSWWHARWDGRRRLPRNLVVHEFAHKLAELNDNPPMPSADLAARWEAVMAAEFDRLRAATDRHRPTLLDPYGATCRTEFFPVCAEAFFHQPVRLRGAHPTLYGVLAEWFRQDPAGRWAPPGPDDESARAEEEYLRHVLAECTAALRHRPSDPAAFRARASVRWALGDLSGADADYDAAVRLDPDDPELRCRRGDLRAGRGQWAEARADYESALADCPKLTAALLGRGVAYHAAGESNRAEADFTEALRIDPEEDEAYSERGHVRLDRGDAVGALADYEAAAGLWPDCVDYHVAVACAAVRSGQFDRAVAAADEAARRDPGRAEPYKHRGAARFHRGEFTAAVADLSDAIRRNPAYAWAYAYRARAHAAVGNETDAARDRSRAAELDPNPDPSLSTPADPDRDFPVERTDR